MYFSVFTNHCLAHFFVLLGAFFLSFNITTCCSSNDDATQITLSQHVHDMTFTILTFCTKWLHVYMVNVEQCIAQSSILPSHGIIFCTAQNIAQ